MTEVTDRFEEARPRRFRPYPEYSESGVDWLGKMPAHWEAKPAKAALIRNDSGVWGDDFDDDGTVVLRSTEQTMQGGWRIEKPARRRLSTREATYARLCVGDLLVTKSSGSAHHIGKTSIVDEQVAALNCCYSNFMQRLRVSGKHVSQFYWYFMNCPVAREQLVFLSSTTTGLGNLNGSILGAIQTPMAPPDEQHAIADFLDRETAKIDALVARKERLIELLQEKRSALITRAVTRGLDPNVPMKDSGVEWLGESPTYWEVKKLGYVTTIGNGSTPNRNEARYWIDGSHPWLTSAKINEGVIATADQFVTDVALRECHLPPVPAGSILVAITGEGQTRGRVASLSIDSTISQHLAYVTPGSSEINAGFLVRLFEARYEWLRDESSGTGSTRAALTCEFLRSARFAFPPRGEQHAIAAFLDREAARIDALIAKVREAIARLREFRTALISAAVTGKIDVREAVPR